MDRADAIDFAGLEVLGRDGAFGLQQTDLPLHVAGDGRLQQLGGRGGFQRTHGSLESLGKPRQRQFYGGGASIITVSAA